MGSEGEFVEVNLKWLYERFCVLLASVHCAGCSVLICLLHKEYHSCSVVVFEAHRKTTDLWEHLVFLQPC